MKAGKGNGKLTARQLDDVVGKGKSDLGGLFQNANNRQPRETQRSQKKRQTEYILRQIAVGECATIPQDKGGVSQEWKEVNCSKLRTCFTSNTLNLSLTLRIRIRDVLVMQNT